MGNKCCALDEDLQAADAQSRNDGIKVLKNRSFGNGGERERGRFKDRMSFKMQR